MWDKILSDEEMLKVEQNLKRLKDKTYPTPP